MLPRRFQLLFGASLVSNVGDGLAFAAFALLAATLTSDPLSIALVNAASTLPFAVFALLAGALIDRTDRRLVMVVANLVCMVAAAVLAGCIAGHVIDVAGLAAFAAIIGLGACLFTIASQAVVPDVVGGVDRALLSQANGRLFGSEVFGFQLAGPALGGAIFAAAHHLPFTIDAVSFAGSALLVGLIPGRYRVQVPGPGPGEARESVRASILAGVSLVARNRMLRSFTLGIAGVNLATLAQEAVLVVLAERRLGLGSTGVGLLFASLAVGGLLATTMSGRLARTHHEATVLRIGFAVLPIGALVAGVAPDAAVCGVGLAITSFGVMVLNVAAGPLRQATVPSEILGRVYAASTMLGRAMQPIGAVLGGLLATLDPRLPYLAGAGFLALVFVAILPGLSRRVIDAERAATDPGPPPSPTP